ncbi:MAG: DUF2059 domain-containing protein [Bauldia sp.]|nr:DUF2059 domain-containing protein [Bauldia sp.]MCW5719364.1 DUF2059 domain-containing protein [Bauldia sp.]
MNRARALIGAIALSVIAALPAGRASAQEITPSHLQAAAEAVHALGTDRDFDLVLPNVATQVEVVLMQQRPDLYRQITATVQAAALELVQRRLDLNNDVARVWALTFTEDELRQITAFYQSPAGQKLALQGQPMMQQTVETLQAWSERVSNELLERTLAQFQAQNIDF